MTEALQHSRRIPITMMLAAFGLSRAKTKHDIDPSQLTSRSSSAPCLEH